MNKPEPTLRDVARMVWAWYWKRRWAVTFYILIVKAMIITLITMNR